MLKKVVAANIWQVPVLLNKVVITIYFLYCISHKEMLINLIWMFSILYTFQIRVHAFLQGFGNQAKRPGGVFREANKVTKKVNLVISNVIFNHLFCKPCRYADSQKNYFLLKASNLGFYLNWRKTALWRMEQILKSIRFEFGDMLSWVKWWKKHGFIITELGCESSPCESRNFFGPCSCKIQILLLPYANLVLANLVIFSDLALVKSRSYS